MTKRKLIENFIAFLREDMLQHKERNSSRRLDVHRWMIRYLIIKLDTISKEE